MKPDHFLHFGIGLILSMVISAGLTVVFWKKYNLGGNEKTGKPVQSSEETAEIPEQAETAETVLYSPMNGEVLPITESEGEASARKPWETAWPSILLRAQCMRRVTVR